MRFESRARISFNEIVVGLTITISTIFDLFVFININYHIAYNEMCKSVLCTCFESCVFCALASVSDFGRNIVSQNVSHMLSLSEMYFTRKSIKLQSTLQVKHFNSFRTLEKQPVSLCNLFHFGWIFVVNHFKWNSWNKSEIISAYSFSCSLKRCR